MAYVLDGKRLAPNKAFVLEDGRQYPANFLKLSTDEEKASLGITFEPDPVPERYDERFYWSASLPKRLEDEPAVDENGDPVLDADGVQVVNKGLKTEWVAKQKEIAGSLLAPTDWYVTRKAETGTEVPADVLAYRESIRTTSGAREAEIASCTTTEELVALLTNQPKVYDEVSGEMVDNTEPFITPWPQG